MAARHRALLLGDLSNLAYRYSAAFSGLSHGGAFTGGLYGFLASIAKLINEQQVLRVGLCKDSPPYLRHAALPSYKGDRASDPKLVANVAVAKEQIEEFCKIMRIPIFSLPGYEADDWIALLASRSAEWYTHIIAWSNDSDLYQLFALRNFALYAGKKGLYTREHFEKEYGDLSMAELRLMLAMVGTHNAVEGIRGVGMVTALRTVRDPVKLRAMRAKYGDLIDRNLELIELPHPSIWSNADAIQQRITTPIFNVREVVRFYAKYGITLTKTMSSAWERISEQY